MAQAKASLGITIPPRDSPLLRSDICHEHGEPSVPFSKENPKSKRMMSSKSGVEGDDFLSKRCREDKQPNASEIYNSLSGEAPCKLEEIATHDLIRVAAVTHQLTQQCMTWRRERMELSEKVEQLEREKHEIELKLIESKHLVSELKAWREKTKKTLLKSNMELKRLERECNESFNAGRAAGECEFAESEEYKTAIRKARLSGAKDFKESSAFKQILATHAAAYEVLGFIKCQSQIFKLGGFKPGFDPELLDLSKDENLKSPAIDNDNGAPETDDPEFGFLAKETMVEHQSSRD